MLTDLIAAKAAGAAQCDAVHGKSFGFWIGWVVESTSFSTMRSDPNPVRVVVTMVTIKACGVNRGNQ